LPLPNQGPYGSRVNPFQLLSVLAVTGALVTTAGDRPRAPGRVVGGPAASGPGTAAALPAFTQFGWVSPPPDSTTPVRMDEMVEAGMTLALPAINDTALDGRLADNLTRLALAGARGMRVMVWDERFAVLATTDPSSPAGRALIDSVVGSYHDDPALAGWYAGDEPPASRFDLLARLRAELAARDPAHPMWNNLLGRGTFATRDAWLAYLREYVATVRPSVLCDDQYDFTQDGDRGLFVENAAGLAAVARESGLPFWSIVLVTQHHVFRPIAPGLLTWQVAQLLAYGARGIGYFTYWTPLDGDFAWGPGLIARDGSRGPLYATVAALAPRVRAAGETLAGLAWVATEHAGSCPTGGTPFAPDDWVSAVEGRAALGHFLGADGARHLLVANSDSASARELALTLPHASSVEVLGAAAGAWDPLASAPVAGGRRVVLPLAAGDFALLRVRGDFGTLRAGAAPALRAWPSPARAQARFSYQGLGAHGRLEVLDLAGRRVWSAAPRAGDGLVTWDGARDGGGRVPPGVYLARLEDARGVAVARLVWLGR
jgi:hypothetical protein